MALWKTFCLRATVFFTVVLTITDGEMLNKEWYSESKAHPAAKELYLWRYNTQQCRCSPPGQCELTYGTCQEQRCHKLWGGPACQHLNFILAVDPMSLGVSPPLQQALNAEPDKCVELPSLMQSIVLKPKWPFNFIAAFLHFDEDVTKRKFQIEVLSAGGHILRNLNDATLTTAFLSPKSMVIRPRSSALGHPTLLVNQITVGKLPRKLCTVFLSAGRNLALRQDVFTSPVFELRDVQFQPRFSVDGSLRSDTPSQCFKSVPTTEKVPLLFWSLTFAYPAVINVVAFWGRKDDPEARRRLQLFTLEYKGSDGQTLSSYQDRAVLSPDQLFPWEVKIRMPSTKPVTAVRISTNLTVGQARLPPSMEDKAIYLELCEVFVIGELKCPKGHNGINCGCVPGYFGEHCRVRCTYCAGLVCGKEKFECDNGCVNGMWGAMCNLTCTVTCNGACDQQTGVCAVSDPEEKKAIFSIGGALTAASALFSAARFAYRAATTAANTYQNVMTIEETISMFLAFFGCAAMITFFVMQRRKRQSEASTSGQYLSDTTSTLTSAPTAPHAEEGGEEPVTQETKEA